MSGDDWSVPGGDVLTSIGNLLDDNSRAVVATIVGVTGSAYRRPGAKMLVEESGAGRGHITAGCLEDEVFDLAADILDAGESRVKTYDLMQDDEDVWGLGVGCNGVIDVLLEPLDERYAPLVAAVEADEPIGAVTVIGGDAPLGAKAYYRDGEVKPASEDFPAWLAAAVEEPAATLVADGSSDAFTVDAGAGADDAEAISDGAEAASVEVFVDGVRPAPRLAVFGSGHDVGPVVELATKNGFRVTVVGFRGAVDLAERFPRADETVTTTPAAVGDDLPLDAIAGAVVMTHNFVDDRLTVDELLRAEVPYVGLLGPRERFEEMLDAFADEGRTFDEAELERLYSPIGLDLGEGSPYGIATSVVAEVMAVRNGRDPAHLSERDGPIHDRVEIESEVDATD